MPEIIKYSRGTYPRTEWHREINRQGQLRRFSKMSVEERKAYQGHWKGKHTKGSEAMKEWWNNLRQDPKTFKEWVQNRSNRGRKNRSEVQKRAAALLSPKEREER